jgi:hypothetical protein
MYMDELLQAIMGAESSPVIFDRTGDTLRTTAGARAQHSRFARQHPAKHATMDFLAASSCCELSVSLGTKRALLPAGSHPPETHLPLTGSGLRGPERPMPQRPVGAYSNQ